MVYCGPEFVNVPHNDPILQYIGRQDVRPIWEGLWREILLKPGKVLKQVTLKLGSIRKDLELKRQN